MTLKNFIKENFALVAGIALPVVLMLLFMLSTMIPSSLSDPPRYDLVFSTRDNNYQNTMPINVNLVVKDGRLVAQYTKNENKNYLAWKKLYLYDASTQKVRELSFGLPPDAATLEGMREEIVAATSDMKLDTNLQAPDGYELSYNGYSHSGLVNEFFIGGRSRREIRLRKGSASFPLTGDSKASYYYYNNVEFIGWVVK